MRVLVDSNIFLNHYRQTRPVDDAIVEAINSAEQAFFSTASIWEIGIKFGKSALGFDVPLEAAIHHGMQSLQLSQLDITQRHAFVAASLPDHHRDPFDRMLVAQAISERLTIITTDRALKSYDVAILGV